MWPLFLWRKETLEQQLVRAWRKGDWQTFARLQTTHPQETAEIALNALDDPNSKIRDLVGAFIGVIEKTPEVRDRILTHLTNNEDLKVREWCATAFLPDEADSPEIRAAFIQALKDPSSDVVASVCSQLGEWGGTESIKALFQTLSHPSWIVRLSACQALIQLEVADARVVSSLEAMVLEPEAALYNAVMDQFKSQPWVKELSFEAKGPVKIETIIEQARRIAAKRQKRHNHQD